MKDENTPLQFKGNKIALLKAPKVQLPEIKEDKTKDYVSWGEDNLYFDYLIKLYEDSTTHKAAIYGIAQQMYGTGLFPVDTVRNSTKMAWKKLVRQSDIRKACLDYKLQGQCSFLIRMTADFKSIYSVEHFPIDKIRSGKVDEETGEVEFFYYCDDWADKNKVKAAVEDGEGVFPAWNFRDETKSEAEYIFVLKPYSPGHYYYATPDYGRGGTLWAALDAEVSKFYSNHVNKGFYATTLINWNNGEPDPEKRDEIERAVKAKFTGTDAETVILSFNESKEDAATVENLQINDAPGQFEFLAKETEQKILRAHRITSPMLLGIKDNTGLGNNADELRTAYVLFRDTVIEPLRLPMIEFFEDCLVFNGDFTPLEFRDLTPPEGVQQARPVSMSKHKDDISDEALDAAFEWLESRGEEIDLEEWEIVDEKEADQDGEDEFLTALNGVNLALARAPLSKPNSSSEQDTSLFKVRYKYAPETADAEKSRIFCQKVVAANKVYRKEDLVAAGDRRVNPGFGPEGADTYNIWFYKGGPNCHHFWKRQVYLRRNNSSLTVNEARRMINNLEPSERKDARWEENPSDVAKRPVDMPNNGYLNPR